MNTIPIIPVVADVLAPNRRQDISYRHDNSAVITNSQDSCRTTCILRYNHETNYAQSIYFNEPCRIITNMHHNDVIMSAMASQMTGVSIAYSTVQTGADQSKHQSSVSLAFVRGIHRWSVNSRTKGQ